MSWVFSKPSYLCLNDPYVHHRPKSSRERGKQMLSHTTKKGRVGKSCYFSDFKHVSEPYTDSIKRERVYQNKRRKSMIQLQRNAPTEPFRYTSPTKKPCGSGTYYGTIGGVITHSSRNSKTTGRKAMKRGRKTKGRRAKSTMRRRHSVQPRNIFTNPPKMGSYGFNGTTLQKDLFRSNGKPDPYDTLREDRKKWKKEHKKKVISGQPFRSSGKVRAYFDSHDKVDASKILATPEKVLERMKKNRKKKKRLFEKKKVLEPFRIGGVLPDTYPEYIPDTYGDKKKKKRKKGNEREHKKVFYPTSSPKSGPCRSIIFGSSRRLY